MGSYPDAPWEARYGTLGDTAEAEFEARFKLGFVRTGLKRPPLRVRDIHPYVRQMPDYLTSRGWVEVMGLGEDQILKLKIGKLEALRFWSMLMPVVLWVWDSHNKRHTEVALERVEKMAITAKIGFFPEGALYYELPAAELFGVVDRGVAI
jgi:hypothetical protein